MSALIEHDFSSRISYELKRAERYRIFLSLLIFNLGPIIDRGGSAGITENNVRERFLSDIRSFISNTIREIDAVSNSDGIRVGLLLPETSRQGAEATARRLGREIIGFCKEYFPQTDDHFVPVEISSYPDAAGARSIQDYIDDFNSGN
jgi:hypothetical protein